MILIATVSLLLPVISLYSVEVTPGTIGQSVFPPKIENVKERLIQNNATELLGAVGWTESPTNNPLILVHSEWIKLGDQTRIFLIFDSTGWVLSESPRVLALLDSDYQVKFWGRFDSAFPFGYATFIGSPSDKEVDLVIIDPATRFSGELLFRHYKVTSEKISSVSNGYTWNRIR